MIKGDFVERQRKTKAGKMVTDKIVKSTTGVEYAIGGKLGAGGVAKVYRARRMSDKKECVFKEYVPSPNTRRMHSNIKKNIQKLMANPLVEEDGVTPLKSFVGPMDKDSLIELPASKGFGYVMELVDMKEFLPVPKLWHADRYPEADILCKILRNTAYFFKRVHFKGWCYKDINEGNIYINYKTGEIRIIDCDNISVQSTKTILGTDGFMAPEVYVTSTPDTYTDYFSMAVLLYRLLVGGFPMDGKKTHAYLMKNNVSVGEAASTIYGKMALFAFDPKDHSNEIRNLVDRLSPKMYQIQTQRWERLPEEIQAGFIRTFSTGLSNVNRHLRLDDRGWMKIAESVGTSGMVKCKCGKTNFGLKQKKGECIYCGKKLPQLKATSKAKPTPNPATPKQGEPTTVTFMAKRDLAPTNLMITAKRQQQIQGHEVYDCLDEGWMKIQYNKAMGLMGAVNQSNYTWIVTDNGVKSECPPGGRVVLKKDMILTILKRKLQLTVTEIR